MDDQDYRTVEAMRTYGGSFVKKLADLFVFADITNKKKLKVAFPEYFEDYKRMSQGKDIIV